MELAVTLNTHGVGTRDDSDWWHQPMAIEEMVPIQSAQLAERLGFHSVFMGDHVGLPEQSPDSVSPLHVEGQTNPAVRQRGTSDADVGGSKRHYPARPNILDGAVVMGAVATHTTTLKMGPSVLIAPYRHPLSDARQFATIDTLSQGRLIMGVGAGWMKEEFDALDRPFDSRLAQLEEAIQVYKSAWTDDLAMFHGQFYNFDRIAMDPKPVRKPHPPIIVGAVTKAGARLAARQANGIDPILMRPHDDPHGFDNLQDEIRREAERVDRDLSDFAMICHVSALVTDAGHPITQQDPRPILGGTAEQVIADLGRFADAGYSLVVIAPVCPSRTFEEYREQLERLGNDVIPAAKEIKPAGEWWTGL